MNTSSLLYLYITKAVSAPARERAVPAPRFLLKSMKKPKYDWRHPSLFPEYDLHPTGKEFRGMRTGIDKNGKPYRNAVIVNTKAYYIEQARKIWGERYDYTDSVYVHGKKPITIYCLKHDYHFRVAMAQNHIMPPRKRFKPTGCPVCRYEKQFGVTYGPEWRNDLKLCAKSNRVGLIRTKPRKIIKSRERIEAEKAERERKRRSEQEYMERWKAKSMKEARFNERVHNEYGYDTSLVDYIDKDHRVTLICPHHGLFQIRPDVLFASKHTKNPHGCWICSGLQDPSEKYKLTTKDFYRRVGAIYRLQPLTFERRRKIKPSTKIKATCKKHGEIIHPAEYWLEGKGCDYCNGKFYPPDWKENASKKHGGKYEYIGEPPRTQSDYIHYICPKHGLQEQRYDLHVNQGCGCPQCANYPNKKTPEQRCEEWIAKCIEKYGEGRYDYSRAHEDYVNNDSLVWIRCCIHNFWFQQTPDNNLRTVNGSCPICSEEFTESHGEAEIRRWLLKHDIVDFKQDEVTIEHHNPRCKRQYLRPDFWLPAYNLFIEYNGEQHYRDVSIFHTGEDWTFEDQQIRDETLRQYCRDHQIQLLEIPYTEFDNIDKILSEKLLLH